MTVSFPTFYETPLKLILMEANCGLVTAWSILKFFRKRTSSAKLIELCHHNRNGVHTIALAVALRRHGLKVSFFSEPDSKPDTIEKRCFRVAKKIGIDVEPAINLDSLLAKLDSRSLAVVFYKTPEGSGHLTPLLGIDGENLILPVSDEGFMSKQEFLIRWSEPEMFRQCLIVSL